MVINIEEVRQISEQKQIKIKKIEQLIYEKKQKKQPTKTQKTLKKINKQVIKYAKLGLNCCIVTIPNNCDFYFIRNYYKENGFSIKFMALPIGVRLKIDWEKGDNE